MRASIQSSTVTQPLLPPSTAFHVANCHSRHHSCATWAARPWACDDGGLGPDPDALSVSGCDDDDDEVDGSLMMAAAAFDDDDADDPPFPPPSSSPADVVEAPTTSHTTSTTSYFLVG